MKVINDLFDYEPYKIVQESEAFKFSIDSILLAEFVETLKPNDKVLDLCTGNGAVPLILSYYFPNEIVAFEIQESIYKLAEESVGINHLEGQIKLIHDDIKVIHKYFPGNNFDVVVANPPYFKYLESSLINENEKKALARHEICLSFEDLFQVVKYALKEKGIFYLVHLPERLEEILFCCEKYKISAKTIQFVYTNALKNATIVLVKCVKNANNALVVRPPVFIQDVKSYKNIFKG